MTRTTDLMPFEPGTLMHRMFHDFDKVFDARGGFPYFKPFRREFGEFPWAPALEVAERDHHMVVTLDLPGLTKDEVHVDVGDGRMTVSGERKQESAERTSDWVRSERSYGSFMRTIPLPEGVKPSDITASFANGVLELRMPLPEKPAGGTTRITIGEPGTAGTGPAA